MVPKDAIGNGLLYAVSDPVSLDNEGPATIVIAYARAIRRSLEEARQPAYVQDFLALAGDEWLKAAKANQGHCILETPGHVIVNSSYRCVDIFVASVANHHPVFLFCFYQVWLTTC